MEDFRWPVDGSEQRSSGEIEISDAGVAAMEQLRSAVSDLLPLPDPNRTKLSDADEMYRVLIANNWNVKQSEKHFRERCAWRESFGVSGLYEWVRLNVRDDIQKDYPHGFCGVDIEGHPVYWERPDPQGIERLLQRYSKEAFVRYHVYMMERARELMRLLHTDRYTIVQDVSQMTLSFIASPFNAAGGILREQARMDQRNYPEMFRWFFMVRAPSSFTAVFRMLNPLLDPRVQKDMFVLGEDFSAALSEKVKRDQTPKQFRGECPVELSACGLKPSSDPLDLSLMPTYGEEEMQSVSLPHQRYSSLRTCEAFSDRGDSACSPWDSVDDAGGGFDCQEPAAPQQSPRSPRGSHERCLNPDRHCRIVLQELSAAQAAQLAPLDVDGDGVITLRDLAAVAKRLGSRPGRRGRCCVVS
eukprot:TRINITY_DN8552_c0_g1_i1.p1 TRINITY_DN8552_c0_g1~~TRINITY_DN8552_c0_g1_i1.p1  ORF type:complete len:414 (+),score=98.10 TRINITY_DN8552_c0_g1_i1:45-1286(+)